MVPTVEQVLSSASDDRKAMTYRQLLLWMERYAEKVDDGYLDMLVVVRVEDLEGELVVGNLYDVEVDSGCGDEDALILDGSCEVSP